MRSKINTDSFVEQQLISAVLNFVQRETRFFIGKDVTQQVAAVDVGPFNPGTQAALAQETVNGWRGVIPFRVRFAEAAKVIMTLKDVLKSISQGSTTVGALGRPNRLGILRSTALAVQVQAGSD